MNNELIKITQDENGNSVVSGRDLHDFLEVKTAYKDWFPRMCEYGFTDGKDFSSILSESTGGRPRADHAMTLDMAKEISMIQRTEKKVNKHVSISLMWKKPIKKNTSYHKLQKKN